MWCAVAPPLAVEVHALPDDDNSTHRPDKVESADVHSLTSPAADSDWPDAPDVSRTFSQILINSSDDDEGLLDLDDLMDTQPPASDQTAVESPKAEPAPALLSKRRSGAVSMSGVDAWKLRSDLNSSAKP